MKKMSRYRSAGACPPRAFGGSEHGEGQALALRWRGRAVLLPRNRPVTVARGPVPRDASSRLNQDLQGHVYNKDISAGFPAEMTTFRISRIISLAAAKPFLKKRFLGP